MCQTGGGYNFRDQNPYSGRNPINYQGSYELQTIRKLFERNFDANGITKTKFENIYFGLGNHDIQNSSVKVDWRGCNLFSWKPKKSFFRWQMWDFIAQMHTGVFCNGTSSDAVYPVMNIDAQDKSFNWEKHSFNYVVNLGPIDVYQMHRYGGDNENGRADGLIWLRERLAQGGIERPIIIVQHYGFSDTEINAISPNWTMEQRDEFLKLLAPYNVIALLVGHIHNTLGTIPERIPLPDKNKTIDEFRPGACGDGQAFAVVRVTKDTFDIAQGNTRSGSGPLWADNQWDKAQYYSTIQSVAIDDRLYLLGRKKNGMEIWDLNTNNHCWERIANDKPPWSDSAGWNLVQYYSTIQTAVVNNELYLFARAARGMQTWKFNLKGGSSVVSGSPALSDVNGWDKVQYYSTIQTAVVNNELFMFARAANGMQTWKFDAVDNSWDSVVSRNPALSDDSG